MLPVCPPLRAAAVRPPAARDKSRSLALVFTTSQRVMFCRCSPNGATKQSDPREKCQDSAGKVIWQASGVPLFPPCRLKTTKRRCSANPTSHSFHHGAGRRMLCGRLATTGRLVTDLLAKTIQCSLGPTKLETHMVFSYFLGGICCGVQRTRHVVSPQEATRPW